VPSIDGAMAHDHAVLDQQVVHGGELGLAFRTRCEAQAADGVESDGPAAVRLEFRDGFAGPAHHAQRFDVQASPRNQAGGARGGAGPELVAFQHEHVGFTAEGQVPGDAAADHAAADDDDSRPEVARFALYWRHQALKIRIRDSGIERLSGLPGPIRPAATSSGER
jgi:hypothetical protein